MRRASERCGDQTARRRDADLRMLRAGTTESAIGDYDLPSEANVVWDWSLYLTVTRFVRYCRSSHSSFRALDEWLFLSSSFRTLFFFQTRFFAPVEILLQCR